VFTTYCGAQSAPRSPLSRTSCETGLSTHSLTNIVRLYAREKFVFSHPKHPPSEIVRTVKSITVREMWEQHESYLESYLWGDGF